MLLFTETEVAARFLYWVHLSPPKKHATAGDARWEEASLLRFRKDEEDEREEDEQTGQTEGNELEKTMKVFHGGA